MNDHKQKSTKPEPAAPQETAEDKFLAQILASVGGRAAISVAKTAELLSISLPTAYELVNRSDFPSFPVNNRTLVSVQGLLEWVRNQSGGHNQ